VIDARPLLLAAGWMSVAACLLHLAVIAGGPDWYRFFGAGEGMAQAAERGSLVPPIMTVVIAAILAACAAFAFGAAGAIRLLPLTRTALVAIAAVLLVRSAMVLAPQFWAPEHTMAFRIVSSAACLTMGLCFALGTWAGWDSLGARSRT
jgi:hypothetical protein